MKFLDAFKINKAPYQIKEGKFSDYKQYLPEAYTSVYMIKSDKTNKLCRWVVKLENGQFVSQYQYFGVRPGKDEAKTVLKMLNNMTKVERAQYYKGFETEIKSMFKTGWDLLEYGTIYKNRTKNPQLYAIAQGRNGNEAIWVLGLPI